MARWIPHDRRLPPSPPLPSPPPVDLCGSFRIVGAFENSNETLQDRIVFVFEYIVVLYFA